MGAEHSRRRHHRHPIAVPVNHGGVPPVLADEQVKPLPANTELIHRKKPRQMDRLRRTLSFRSRKKNEHRAQANAAATPTLTTTAAIATPPTTTTTTTTTAPKNGSATTTSDSKPLQWQDDEKSVRVGACSFTVKYLGSVEVQESRGMHVCEQAIQALLNHKSKHIKAVLHISGDALRVVDETNKGLIVDQTIEKVSFCAPDRHHEKGFAYICRDGTTRRWLCHGFLSIKDTGERLSHAVGCAFQICLERKQKRDRECSVTVEYSQNGTSFTRFGSFRTTSITERIIDPQSAIVAEPIPYQSTSASNASTSKTTMHIERPRPKGTDSDAFIRSASLRLGDLNQGSFGAFRRQTSLRPSDLPSIQEARYKNLPSNTTIPEEVEPVLPPTHDLNRLSLIDSTNTSNGHPSSIDPFVFPSSKPATNPPVSFVPTTTTAHHPSNENFSNNNVWLTNSAPLLADRLEEAIDYPSKQPSVPTSINDAFNSNLSALVQSNNPTNPFSPYGYSMAAQAQSPHLNHRQPAIFTPKRGTNPFDDDLIRR